MSSRWHDNRSQRPVSPPIGPQCEHPLGSPERRPEERSIDRESVSADEHARPRDPATEILCEVPAGHRCRAGRGVALWGRHRLAADSVEALRTVGIFQVVRCDDLADSFSSRKRARSALRNLESRGLLRIERFRRGRVRIGVASLTQSGKRVLTQHVDPRDADDDEAQTYRTGPASESQVLHDTAVYRAARLEIQAIVARGGRILRVRTDADLQRLASRHFARARRNGDGMGHARAAAAAELGLAEHGGRLAFPDVRIEYHDPGIGGGASGSAAVDLEVTTPDYRSSALRAKAASGFRIYSMAPDGSLSKGHFGHGPAISG